MGIRNYIVCALLTLAVVQFPSAANSEAAGASLEYKVKTAFLYKFAKYVQWPDSGGAEDFKIAVLGDSPITGPLKELALKPADGRKIKVQRLRSAEEIGDCHILFISAAERDRLGEVLKKVEGRNILTVGDSKGLAALGVAVNFVVVEGRLRFEINRRAADRAGLQISSELLKLAILVEEEAKDVQP